MADSEYQTQEWKDFHTLIAFEKSAIALEETLTPLLRLLDTPDERERMATLIDQQKKKGISIR